MSKLSFGIKELDQYFSKALRPGTTILIAGYPGAGKTTLAATICYMNCLRGEKALYISFFEHKDRFSAQTGSLNLDFSEFEKRGLFRYIKLPIIPDQESINSFIRNLMSKVVEFKPKILVIDGITPLVRVMKDEAVIRSFLQTVIYEIPRVMGGMLILVADLPYGTEEVKLAGIEFTVDIVFILKYKVITTRVIRFMEIRKVRGAPLTIAEVPYQITSEKGIRFFFPVLPHELKPPSQAEELYFNIPVLDNALAPLYKGMCILVTYPPHARTTIYAVAPFLKLIEANKLNTVIISYKYSCNEISSIMKEVAVSIRLPIRNVIGYIKNCYGINPTAMSFQEAFFREDKIIEDLNPDLIIIHGLEVILKLVEYSGTGLDRLYSSLYNRILNHRSNGRIILYLVPNVGEPVKTLASLSDMVYTIKYTIKDGEVKPMILAWKKTGEPITISPTILLQQLRGQAKG